MINYNTCVCILLPAQVALPGSIAEIFYCLAYTYGFGRRVFATGLTLQPWPNSMQCLQCDLLLVVFIYMCRYVLNIKYLHIYMYVQ